MHPRAVVQGSVQGTVEGSFCHGTSQDPQAGPGEGRRGSLGGGELHDPGVGLDPGGGGCRRLTHTPLQSICAASGSKMRPNETLSTELTSADQGGLSCERQHTRCEYLHLHGVGG